MTIRILIISLISTLFLFSNDAIGQGKPIELINPSFEGTPSAGRTPAGWYDCGREIHPGETPPDMHGEFGPGNLSSIFEVKKKAHDGRTYVGLVVRDNDTWEAISQRLPEPLEQGQCYEMSMFISKSESYWSQVAERDVQSPPEQKVIRDTSGGGRNITLVNHNTPVVLRIWGSNSYCGKREKLHESPVVTHDRWLEVELKLEPKGTYSYIIFEAFYKTPLLFPYNGNLLIDNISAITPVPCQELEPQVAITSKKKKETQIKKFTLTGDVKNVKNKYDITIIINNNLIENFSFDESSGKVSVQTNLKKGNNTFEIRAKNSAGEAKDFASINYVEEEVAIVVPTKPRDTPSSYENTSPPPPPPPTPKITKELDRRTLSKGKTIQINKLYFNMDSFEINEDSKPALEEIYEFLMNNNDIVVEIGGHTNDRCDSSYCNKLSENRAKAVVDYLKEKGIEDHRLAFKGYGKTKPVATNRTAEGRKKNQRVEIKVLSIG